MWQQIKSEPSETQRWNSGLWIILKSIFLWLYFDYFCTLRSNTFAFCQYSSCKKPRDGFMAAGAEVFAKFHPPHSNLLFLCDLFSYFHIFLTISSDTRVKTSLLPVKPFELCHFPALSVIRSSFWFPTLWNGTKNGNKMQNNLLVSWGGFQICDMNEAWYDLMFHTKTPGLVWIWYEILVKSSGHVPKYLVRIWANQWSNSL